MTGCSNPHLKLDGLIFRWSSVHGDLRRHRFFPLTFIHTLSLEVLFYDTSLTLFPLSLPLYLYVSLTSPYLLILILVFF